MLLQPRPDLTLLPVGHRWALPPLPAWVTTCAAVLCAVNLATGAALAAKHSRWAPWLLPFHSAVPLNEPCEFRRGPHVAVMNASGPCQLLQRCGSTLTCWISADLCTCPTTQAG